MNPLERKNLKLKYIDKERKTCLDVISTAQSRIEELNEQRQNIIMSQEAHR